MSKKQKVSPDETTAFAYRSGHIGFMTTMTSGRSIPDGALFLARGPANIVTPLITGNARLAYDNETWLVPGVPEAADDDEAFQAFMRFFERVQGQLGKRSQLPLVRERHAP